MQRESISTALRNPDEVLSPSLADLTVGQSGRISRLTGAGAVRQRLLDMGMIRGAVVELRRVAPLGDPLEISVKGYNLAIRRNEAESILLHPQSK